MRRLVHDHRSGADNHYKILFSLVVASRCQPCFEAHFRRARELGITQAELDEAAWCAIAMGGAPVKMFYQESLSRIQTAAGNV